jgi:hypothetical protein
MTTPIASGVVVPDKLDTSTGMLNLSDGYPATETGDKNYDNLDHSRAQQACLPGIPIVSQTGMRHTLRKFGRTTRRVRCCRLN